MYTHPCTEIPNAVDIVRLMMGSGSCESVNSLGLIHSYLYPWQIGVTCHEYGETCLVYYRKTSLASTGDLR